MRLEGHYTMPPGCGCSSYEFRNLMPRLAARWLFIAPNYPGDGYSGVPESFDYSFDGYADRLDRLVRQLGIERFVLYLHDFGSPNTGSRKRQAMPILKTIQGSRRRRA